MREKKIQNENDERWIDGIAESLNEVALKESDSFETCFWFSTEVFRRYCSDPYIKTNYLIFLLLVRQESGMEFDEELFNECRLLSEQIIDFDERHDVIGGLVMNANKAHRYDLREKVYRAIRMKGWNESITATG